MSKPDLDSRCPYHSRAWNCRCDLPAGHDGLCNSMGDGFAPGWDPNEGPPMGPKDKERSRGR